MAAGLVVFGLFGALFGYIGVTYLQIQSDKSKAFAAVTLIIFIVSAALFILNTSFVWIRRKWAIFSTFGFQFVALGIAAILILFLITPKRQIIVSFIGKQFENSQYSNFVEKLETQRKCKGWGDDADSCKSKFESSLTGITAVDYSASIVPAVFAVCGFGFMIEGLVNMGSFLKVGAETSDDENYEKEYSNDEEENDKKQSKNAKKSDDYESASESESEEEEEEEEKKEKKKQSKSKKSNKSKPKKVVKVSDSESESESEEEKPKKSKGKKQKKEEKPKKSKKQVTPVSDSSTEYEEEEEPPKKAPKSKGKKKEDEEKPEKQRKGKESSKKPAKKASKQESESEEEEKEEKVVEKKMKRRKGKKAKEIEYIDSDYESFGIIEEEEEEEAPRKKSKQTKNNDEGKSRKRKNHRSK